MAENVLPISVTLADGCCSAASGANTVAPQRHAVLSRRVRLLVSATITYNIVEAAGAVASSAALTGFGLDSLIEVSQEFSRAAVYHGVR